jgi:hypothetical protein
MDAASSPDFQLPSVSRNRAQLDAVAEVPEPRSGGICSADGARLDRQK